MHRPLIGRVRDMGVAVLVATIGLSIAADALLSLLFGGDPRQAQAYVSAKPFIIAQIPLQWSFVVIVAVLIVISSGFAWSLRHTSIGHQLVALQQDPEGAPAARRPREPPDHRGLCPGGLLSALSGFLITPLSVASASAGSTPDRSGLRRVALGGFGSLRGAIAGGLVAGLVEGIVPLCPNGNAVDPILLGIIVLVLLIRPVGMFGRPELVRESDVTAVESAPAPARPAGPSGLPVTSTGGAPRALGRHASYRGHAAVSSPATGSSSWS